MSASKLPTWCLFGLRLALPIQRRLFVQSQAITSSSAPLLCQSPRTSFPFRFLAPDSGIVNQFQNARTDSASSAHPSDSHSVQELEIAGVRLVPLFLEVGVHRSSQHRYPNLDPVVGDAPAQRSVAFDFLPASRYRWLYQLLVFVEKDELFVQVRTGAYLLREVGNLQSAWYSGQRRSSARHSTLSSMRLHDSSRTPGLASSLAISHFRNAARHSSLSGKQSSQVVFAGLQVDRNCQEPWASTEQKDRQPEFSRCSFAPMRSQIPYPSIFRPRKVRYAQGHACGTESASHSAGRPRNLTGNLHSNLQEGDIICANH